MPTEFVKRYVRAGGADGELLDQMIEAARQYLENAGVPRAAGESGSGGPAYWLAVALHVDMHYNPGKDKELLQKSLDAYVLQSR